MTYTLSIITIYVLSMGENFEVLASKVNPDEHTTLSSSGRIVKALSMMRRGIGELAKSAVSIMSSGTVAAKRRDSAEGSDSPKTGMPELVKLADLNNKPIHLVTLKGSPDIMSSLEMLLTKETAIELREKALLTAMSAVDFKTELNLLVQAKIARSNPSEKALLQELHQEMLIKLGLFGE